LALVMLPTFVSQTQSSHPNLVQTTTRTCKNLTRDFFIPSWYIGILALAIALPKVASPSEIRRLFCLLAFGFDCALSVLLALTFVHYLRFQTTTLPLAASQSPAPQKPARLSFVAP